MGLSVRVAGNTVYAPMHARARRICSALHGSALGNVLITITFTNQSCLSSTTHTLPHRFRRRCMSATFRRLAAATLLASNKLVLARCLSGTELELSVQQTCYDNMDCGVTCVAAVILDRFRVHRDLPRCMLRTTVSNTIATVPQTLTASLSSNLTIIHPSGKTGILKRIPKGARPAAAILLTKLMNAVLQQPSSLSAWSRLLNFSGACLARPIRGG
jgi:hypothetical protein